MQLKAKNISGSKYTSEDILQVTLDLEGEKVITCNHSIELISGVDVTHGGGAEPLQLLNYTKPDFNGDVDPTNIQMHVKQLSKGVSTIKVCATVFTEEANVRYEEAKTENGTEEEFEAMLQSEYGWNPDDDTFWDDVVPEGVQWTPVSFEDYLVRLKTGELEISWSDDEFV